MIWINRPDVESRLLDADASRKLKFMGRIPQMTWYVSYIASGDLSGERGLRATMTFAGEREARKFARAKFEAGDKTLVAGTINPVSPKRVIPSSAIPDWLDEAPDR